MRRIKILFQHQQLREGYAKERQAFRQMVVAASCLILAACGGGAKQGEIGYVKGFYGGVAADEPRAALIGREILSMGGSAVDAAVATYFALSVTLPSSASLGGGGVCVVHDINKKQTVAIDFLPGMPKVVSSMAVRPTAIPGNLRGFFALHARYGRLRWERLIGPAESLARFRSRVSRALAADLSTVGGSLLADNESRRVFAGQDGAPLTEGGFVEQLDLATFLGRVRSQGVGAFYNGAMTIPFVEAVTAAGGTISADDLRGYAPVWRDTVKVPVGFDTAHFVPPPAAAGLLEAQIIAMLDEGGYGSAGPEGDAHLFAEAAVRAFADRGRWLAPDGSIAEDPQKTVSKAHIKGLMASYDGARRTTAHQVNLGVSQVQENPAATGFVVVDGEGSAVACNVTLYNLFGTGTMIPGTGMYLPSIPSLRGKGPTSLGPVIMANPHTHHFKFAAAATGGVAAPTALSMVMGESVFRGVSLNDALRMPRIHRGGVPDTIYF
ncbi:MAG: gamma-glutamyltransferase, partial [Rhodospirillales bacterium]|nr:gamma-glutamyltransferase [Rhodospirillales bacterium]